MRLRVINNSNTQLNLTAPTENNITFDSEFSLTTGVNDVQINGESIVEEGVANIVVTQAQSDAVNSGITAEKVSSYDDKVKVIRSANGALIFFKNTYEGGQ